MTYWSGVADEYDRCHLGGTPHGLMDVFGLRSTEIDALYDWDENGIVAQEDNHLGLSKTYTSKYYCEIVKTDSAKTLFTYKDDFYQGMPAVTCNEFGKGKAYYVATDAEKEFFEDFYKSVVKEAGISAVIEDVPAGVEVTSRENDDASYIFLQNFGRKPAEVQIPEGYEVIWGAAEQTIAPLETKVLKRIK